jgi:hypothetical protein
MFRPRQLAAITGIVSLVFGGCGKQVLPPPPQATAQVRLGKPLVGPPEVTSEEEPGFHDLVLFIQDHKRLQDGSQVSRVVGTHSGRQVGLEVVLGPTWQAGALGKDIPLVTYRGIAAYRSTGADSDAFVQVLDQLYGTKISPKTMAREARFTGISLEGDPRDLAKGSVKIKLFFDSGKEGDYAELFTNIQLPAHRLEVHEKDEGYRSAVVRALQGR